LLFFSRFARALEDRVSVDKTGARCFYGICNCTFILPTTATTATHIVTIYNLVWNMFSAPITKHHDGKASVRIVRLLRPADRRGITALYYISSWVCFYSYPSCCAGNYQIAAYQRWTQDSL